MRLPATSFPGCLTSLAPVFPRDSTLVAEGSGESWETLTDATDVVAGPAAVHAEGAGLGTAVAVEPRGADWGCKGKWSAAQGAPASLITPPVPHSDEGRLLKNTGRATPTPHPGVPVSAERSCGLVLFPLRNWAGP